MIPWEDLGELSKAFIFIKPKLLPGGEGRGGPTYSSQNPARLCPPRAREMLEWLSLWTPEAAAFLGTQ